MKTKTRIYGKNFPYIFMGEKIISMTTRDKKLIALDKVLYTTIQIVFEDGSILAGRVNRTSKDDTNLFISKSSTYTGKKYFYIINGMNLINIANSHEWEEYKYEKNED